MTEDGQARSFGQAAELYDRYRPGYAPAAVTWALGERPLRVADLGAGTGILSRLLRQLGHEVIAIEPDEQMRAQLARASPGVRVLSGSAEAIPLADAAVDAVVAGQAYHWFSPVQAHEEIARVLTDKGVFAALWNDPDGSAQWTVKFAAIIDGSSAFEPRPLSDFGPRFDPVSEEAFPNDIEMTADRLLAVATTRSPYLMADEAGRRELLDAIRALVEEAGLGGGPFAMPHITRVHAAHLR